MAAIRITTSGVKQHKATKTVPAIAAYSPFFDVFGEILTIPYLSDNLYGFKLVRLRKGHT
jgi:hypothetical protein